MADPRERVLIDNIGAKPYRSSAISQLAAKAKLALRQFVLATSNTPLRALYIFVYRAHVWYGVRVLSRLPAVRAVYLTRGMASGQIVPGISDVDFAVFGDWTDDEHAHVFAAMRRLSASSPLYERRLSPEARTVASIQPLFDSDFLLMGRLDEGRTRWKLLHGEHVLATLPMPPPARVAGGYYMELRLWWSHFTHTAFGAGVLATDAAFRNSICYKAVSESLATIDALGGAPFEPLRRKVLAKAMTQAPADARPYLERLEKSGVESHRRFDGDICADTLRFLLPTLERVHAVLDGARAFEPLPGCAPAEVDATVHETLRTPEVESHAAKLIEHVKKSWTGYRAAFLTPCLSFYNPDDLSLLFDIDPSRPPNVTEIREVARLHAVPAAPLRQRLTLFLLLPHGAYQIEPAGPIDLWHLLMCRASNPDLFDLITRPEFALDGPPRPSSVAPVWTRFASALVDEEIAVRRSGMAKVAAVPNLTPLDLLRNIWRHLQLDVIAHTTRSNRPILPLTPAAIQRALMPLGLLDPVLVDELKHAYIRALAGDSVDIRPQLARLMDALAERGHSK